MNLRQAVIGAVGFACSLASVNSIPAQESELNVAPAPRSDAEKATAPAPASQSGWAAFYHMTCQGRRTANGESFDHNELTAAHKTLPFGTLVRVINLRNNKSVIVRVNDRGPMQPDRVIDVTRRAAGLLGFVQQGMTRVALEILPLGAPAK
jgi:rare lipoprotein A